MSTKSKKTREAVAAADYQVESASTIPWSEWTDAELKAEKWDLPKSNEIERARDSDLFYTGILTPAVDGTDGHFLDPEPRLMPPSLEPHDWKRGSSLRNLSSNPVVFSPNNEHPDFVKNNKHILHSQFVRWFISTMLNLQYVGHNGLQVEGDSPNFAWLGKSPWQGWMYVYSMNKTGSSASQHRPVVNPNGKYVVRLYFMGSWRRFIIDDMIPVDKDGSPLLPRTENDFELWPMLLAKAMIKLAALSWTGQREIADFHPVSCLTGWICLPLDTKCLSESEKWGPLIKYVDREDEAEVHTNKQNAEDKKKEDPRPSAAIFAIFSNAEDAVDPDIARCLNYPIYIDKVKDMTLDKSQANSRWKLYRYFDWASKHSAVVGSRTGPGPAIRSLRMIIPLRQCSAEENVADSMEEIGVWADFRKIAPYLDELFVFYKPSDFEYYTRVSDVLNITSADSQLHVSAAGSRVKSQATVVKDGKKAQTESGSFRRSVKWQQNISGSKNSPLYMLIDSIGAKFVLIEFCAAPNSASAARSYLIFEEHNFFEISRHDDPAVLVNTVSTRATIFEAEPGRHLYRVFFRPGNSYFIRILSDTIFHVGDRLRMYELMGLESDRVDAIVKNISDRISAAIQQFGRPGYAEELRALYNSYMPLVGAEDKRSAKSVHRLFITELEKLIKETFSDVESRAVCHSLRVFFLNPLIGVRCTVNQAEEYNPPEFSIAEKAAVKIQSFFRMALIKMYKNTHDPSHIRHSAILQSLRRVVELFDYSKRESIATFLIRQIIWSTCTQGKSRLYPCLGDLDQVLNVEEWRGVVKNVQPGQWVPILRAILNAPSEDATVYAGIDLATSLPRYVIRVVNNETYREVKRFVTKVATAHYPYVRLGYTVIGYGWSDGYKSKELGWCVRVTTVKGRPTFRQMQSGSKSSSFGTKPPSMVVHELSNNYIPNSCNIIGKWIVTVSIDSLLSFRLSTSYNGVESEIKIYDKQGEALCQASGGSVLILPVAYLSAIEKGASGEVGGDDSRPRNRSKSSISDQGKNREDHTTEYYLQAYVTNDSWPLTSTEWTVANEARARGTVYDPRYGRTSVSSVSKRSTKTRVQNLHGDGDVTSGSTSQTIFQHPLCKLQVLVDAGAKINIEEDRRREIEISSMKRVWEDGEPGRLLRGRELREEFFKSNSTVLETLRNSGDSDSVEIRTLKPWSNLSRILPPWKTTTYVLKNDDEEEDERWVKTEGDEEMLRNQRAINSLDFYQSHAVNMEDEIGLFQERRTRYSNLWNSYMMKSADWKSLADAVCQKRDDYVADVRTAMSLNGVNNKNKNKNKKNGK